MSVIPGTLTRRLAVGAGVMALAAACHHASADPGDTPAVRRLEAIAGQPLMIAPVQSVRWSITSVNNRDVASVRSLLDSALTDTLRQRVGNAEWVFAPALLESFKQNPTYATDPRALAVQPLRSGKLKVGDRLPEPLASQLRTMIALHEGRLVLLPVELRVDSAAAGSTRAVLQLMVIDPRGSVVRWSGEVIGPDMPTFGPGFAGPLASRVADLFVAK